MTPEERRLAGRAIGVSTVAFLVGVFLWQTRDELEMSIPAMLLSFLLGLLGVGTYHLVRRFRLRGRPATRMSDLGFLLSAAAAIAVPAASSAWYSGEWLGSRTAVGSVVAGFTFACILWFGRMAFHRFPPARATSTSAGSADPKDRSR